MRLGWLGQEEVLAPRLTGESLRHLEYQVEPLFEVLDVDLITRVGLKIGLRRRAASPLIDVLDHLLNLPLFLFRHLVELVLNYESALLLCSIIVDVSEIVQVVWETMKTLIIRVLEYDSFSVLLLQFVDAIVSFGVGLECLHCQP